MLCPKCHIEMRSENSHMVFTGDDSPNTETKAYMQSDFVCRNKKCDLYGEIQGTVKVEMNQ